MCNFSIFYFAQHMSGAEAAWHISECIVVLAVTVANYFGHPRDLPRPLSLPVRSFAFLIMIGAGSAWIWLVVQTILSSPAEEWPNSHHENGPPSSSSQ